MTRIIRHACGEGAKYLPLLLKSQRLWDELQSSTGADIFHQTGVLNIGPKDAVFINNVAKSAKEYQLPTIEYNSEQLRQRWPQFNFNSDYKAIFESSAGYLNSENAIHTYIKLGKQNGVSQDFSARVRSIVDSNGVVEIKTDQITYYAKKVIVAAGTWVKELIPNIPIQPTRKVFTWFNIDDDNLNESSGFPAR